MVILTSHGSCTSIKVETFQLKIHLCQSIPSRILHACALPLYHCSKPQSMQGIILISHPLKMLSCSGTGNNTPFTQSSMHSADSSYQDPVLSIVDSIFFESCLSTDTWLFLEPQSPSVVRRKQILSWSELPPKMASYSFPHFYLPFKDF